MIQFPSKSIKYCLTSQNINLKDIKAIVYYEKPLLTFERLLETYIATSPRGIRSFIAAMQVWLKEKIFLKSYLKNEFKKIQKSLIPHEKPFIPKLLFSEHHLSHAASAFYPSPFKEAVILCMDAVATTGLVKIMRSTIMKFSLGLLYSALHIIVVLKLTDLWV